ncbi:hypothetical protein LX36DRAFT_660972 [Colletotrichum falcatum]|nr:hypothetical protein LX36DRAFT_660972 [Colletotrichum falcatum]
MQPPINTHTSACPKCGAATASTSKTCSSCGAVSLTLLPYLASSNLILFPSPPFHLTLVFVPGTSSASLILPIPPGSFILDRIC